MIISLLVICVCVSTLFAYRYYATARDRERRLHRKERMTYFEHDISQFTQPYNVMNILEYNTVQNLIRMMDIDIQYHDRTIGYTKIDPNTGRHTFMIPSGLSYADELDCKATLLAKLIRCNSVDFCAMTLSQHYNFTEEEKILDYYKRALLVPIDALSLAIRSAGYMQMGSGEKENFRKTYAEQLHVPHKLVGERINDYWILNNEG